MTTERPEPEEEPPAPPKRKWTGLAKWLLIANLVFGGIGVCTAEPDELILMLPSYVSVWMIYAFKRLGFYLLVAIHALSIWLALAHLTDTNSVDFEAYLSVLFQAVLVLIVASLIVHSRWKDMDPPFWEKRASEGE